MTNQQHPITPPPELVQQWRAAASNVPASLSTDPGGRRDYIDYIATQAARWGADQEYALGADQELEACLEWLTEYGWSGIAYKLRHARRPKPPSLKEQALNALEHLALGPDPTAFLADMDTIRRALEQLTD
jgi:hypothetical protein